MNYEPRHAQVARSSVEAAGLSGIVDVRVGRALELLLSLPGEGFETFDLVFIDADKASNADYLAFTTLTPHLSDMDWHRQWEQLLDAAARQLVLDNPRTGAAAALDLLDNALAAGDSASTLLDLDTESYCTVNPADRSGENDYEATTFMLSH